MGTIMHITKEKQRKNLKNKLGDNSRKFSSLIPQLGPVGQLSQLMRGAASKSIDVLYLKRFFLGLMLASQCLNSKWRRAGSTMITYNMYQDSMNFRTTPTWNLFELFRENCSGPAVLSWRMISLSFHQIDFKSIPLGKTRVLTVISPNSE